MLTDLDAVLFPDDCEVVEIPSHDRRIYLIMKNGSSSLRTEALDQGWRILKNQDLQSLASVDVYLRDPAERYVSGINTFVQHLVRDEISLDPLTCEILASRYCFINRHYLPQWHWLVNLARFINDKCVIKLHMLEDLNQVTAYRDRAGVRPVDHDRALRILAPDKKLHFWFLLDRILLGYCGQSLTWRQIMQIYQEHPARPLQILQDRMESVRYVLC